MPGTPHEPLLVSLETLSLSGWREVTCATSRDGYAGAYQAFLDAAKAARTSGNDAQADCFQLLAGICSMYLKPDSPNAPFGALWVGPDGRTMLPEDIAPAQMTILAEFASAIDDALLRARLFDLAWQVLRPRRPSDARSAVVAYRELVAVQPHDSVDATSYFQRALALARMVGDEGAHDAIVQVLAASVLARGPSALAHARLLRERGEQREAAAQFGKVLSAEGVQRASAGDHVWARDFFSEAGKWSLLAGDGADAAVISLRLAESYVAEASARESAQQPSHMTAAHFYESAIQTLRSIPRSHRAQLGVEQRLEDLQARLAEAGARSVEEMGRISSGEIDISQMVDAARKSVQGHALPVALLHLAHVARVTSVSELRRTVEEQARKHPLRLLFGATSLSADGRVVSKRPGLSLAQDDATSREAVIWGEMIQHYQLTLGLAVQGQIMPSLNAVLLEHTVRESDLLVVCERSPIVPPGRERTFARGLLAGFERDFLVALHILAPQIENLVRWHLKEADVRTTSLDAAGVVNESGLGALMDIPQTNSILGEDVAFELTALFCDPAGPNLRNEVAHGLVDDEQAFSTASVQAWWLTLHLVFSAFWNSIRAQRKSGSSASKTDGDEPPLASS